MKKMKRGFDPLPEFPIETILLELGAEIVPGGPGWQKMRCPFHEDRTASAAVNNDINAFVCHSCGVSGDSLKLLQTQLGLNFVEALGRAGELTGDQAPGLKRSPRKQRRASSLLGIPGN